MALARANSRSPSAPWIRPNPDSPTPPNGSAGTITNPITELTEVIPLRSDRAAAMAALRSLAKTADPSPYRPALANDTASARFATGVTVTVGPNVSSVTAVLCSGTSVSTIGRTKGAATAAPPFNSAPEPPEPPEVPEAPEPPEAFGVSAIRPPRASASATCLATISPCAGEVIGPYEASASDPGRNADTRCVSRSRNVWYTASAT